MNKIRVVTKTENITDNNTGELLSSTSTSIGYEQEPDYVKLYLKDISMIHDLSGSNNAVMHALLGKMNYDGEVVLVSKMKEEICARISIAKTTFEHSIGTLVKKGVLIKKGNNFYLFNPYLFARGKWNSIKQIRMTINYSQSGREIKSEFEPQMEIIA